MHYTLLAILTSWTVEHRDKADGGSAIIIEKTIPFNSIVFNAISYNEKYICGIEIHIEFIFGFCL